MLKLTIFLIGVILGSFTMYVKVMPEIAEWRVTKVKVEAFSECVENKIFGIDDYADLYLINVLDCYQVTIK